MLGPRFLVVAMDVRVSHCPDFIPLFPKRHDCIPCPLFPAAHMCVKQMASFSFILRCNKETLWWTSKNPLLMMTSLMVAACGWLGNFDAFPFGGSALEYTRLLKFLRLDGRYLWSFLTELDGIQTDLVGGHWFNNVENVPAIPVETIEHGKGYMSWCNGSFLPHCLYTFFFSYVFGAFVVRRIALRGLRGPPVHG